MIRETSNAAMGAAGDDGARDALGSSSHGLGGRVLLDKRLIY
jgi:hypothetical protein